MDDIHHLHCPFAQGEDSGKTEINSDNLEEPQTSLCSKTGITKYGPLLSYHIIERDCCNKFRRFYHSDSKLLPKLASSSSSEPNSSISLRKSPRVIIPSKHSICRFFIRERKCSVINYLFLVTSLGWQHLNKIEIHFRQKLIVETLRTVLLSTVSGICLLSMIFILHSTFRFSWSCPYDILVLINALYLERNTQ